MARVAQPPRRTDAGDTSSLSGRRAAAHAESMMPRRWRSRPTAVRRLGTNSLAEAHGARGSVVALLTGTVLLGGCMLAGRWLTGRGVDLHLGSAFPLSGQYGLHVGPWLLPCVVVALLGLRFGLGLATALPWRRLCIAAYVGSAAWATALAAVAGPAAIAAPLTRHGEYLTEVHRVNSVGVGAYLDTFTGFIVGGPDAPQWATHVAGHPPLSTLLFALLARAGLTGPGWAAALCIAVGAGTAPAIISTLRVLAGESAARQTAPFVVFAPAALWVATSADAVFAGVAAASVSALAHSGRSRARWSYPLALIGGLGLGTCLMLSYGLVLLAPIAVAAFFLGVHRWSRRIPLLLAAGVGIGAVLAGFAVAGFWWPDGLRLTSERVMAGPGWQDRPTAYFLLANPAALVVAVGPAVVAALPLLARLFPMIRLRRHRAASATGTRGDAQLLAALPVAALVSVALAIGSNLSKGEVERIYLPFTVWLLPLCALLPAVGRRAGHARGWLTTQIGWTILVAATTSLHW